MMVMVVIGGDDGDGSDRWWSVVMMVMVVMVVIGGDGGYGSDGG